MPRRFFTWVLVSFLCMAGRAQAVLFDHSAYDTILQKTVNEEGRVNYRSIRLNSLSALESYFERQSDVDMAGWPYPERLAFWINVYNSHVLYWVAQKPGLKKISDDFDLFKQPFKVAGQMLSLNDIEHRVLRGVTNPDKNGEPIDGVTLTKRDPRIHFALVCGAVSCPRLRSFAYTAENVEDTLLANANYFANSSQQVSIDQGTLKLSSLLKWYAKDFASQGGVAAFLSERVSPERREDAAELKGLLAKGVHHATYVYDWTVNAQ